MVKQYMNGKANADDGDNDDDDGSRSKTQPKAKADANKTGRLKKGPAAKKKTSLKGRKCCSYRLVYTYSAISTSSSRFHSFSFMFHHFQFVFIHFVFRNAISCFEYFQMLSSRHDSNQSTDSNQPSIIQSINQCVVQSENITE